MSTHEATSWQAALPLATERLRLRLLVPADADRIAALANDEHIARFTGTPYPYEHAHAVGWIDRARAGYERGDYINLAAEHQTEQALIGAVRFKIDPRNRSAVVGGWMGRAYWGGNYMEEALRCFFAFGFRHLALNRIEGQVLRSNHAQLLVCSLLGMKHEGTLREAYREDDVYIDQEVYSILRRDFDERTQAR